MFIRRTRQASSASACKWIVFPYQLSGKRESQIWLASRVAIVQWEVPSMRTYNIRSEQEPWKQPLVGSQNQPDCILPWQTYAHCSQQSEHQDR